MLLFLDQRIQIFLNISNLQFLQGNTPKVINKYNQKDLQKFYFYLMMKGMMISMKSQKKNQRLAIKYSLKVILNFYLAIQNHYLIWITNLIKNRGLFKQKINFLKFYKTIMKNIKHICFHNINYHCKITITQQEKQIKILNQIFISSKALRIKQSNKTMIMIKGLAR